MMIINKIAFLAIALVALSVKSDSFFQGYQKVISYSYTPDILMLPAYDSDGNICEIEIVPRHYINKSVDFNNRINQSVIEGIVDRLITPEEAGSIDPDYKNAHANISGRSMVETKLYENIQVHSFYLLSSSHDDSNGQSTFITAIINWRKRQCK